MLADRGFGDQQLYAVLTDFGFDFIIRFRGGVIVERRDGDVRTADAWVPPNGRIRHLRGARVTRDPYALDGVVCVQARGMQAPWCLAIGGAAITGAQAVRLYGRRFTIEEAFRDVKDPRYGLGMSATHVRDPRRRDRLLLICAMAMTLRCAGVGSSRAIIGARPSGLTCRPFCSRRLPSAIAIGPA